MELDIKKFPDPILREKCSDIGEVNKDIRKLADNMLETMKKEDGIGLAGPQVGESKMIFVTGVDKERVFINPKITKKIGRNSLKEGCLSLPGIQCEVERAEKIKIEALNKKGEEFELEAEGVLAACLQHEFDHLKGRLIIDYT